MEYHDNSEPAYRDYAQIANNEGAYIPMEDVDAALRRIEEAAAEVGGVLPHQCVVCPVCTLLETIREERERFGLPKEAKA